MSSEQEAAPCKKRKLEESATNNDIPDNVRSLNKMFPKINNLEYFPLKVLLQIFASVDDIGLLSLAENSTRFENIARLVLNTRYTHKYLTVDSAKYNKQRYMDFFEFFGNDIKAFEVKDCCRHGENHWIKSLLNTMKNLEKFELRVYHLPKSLNHNFFQEYVPSTITHLIIHNRFGLCGPNGFVLSKFYNLKKFELVDSPCVAFERVKEVIHNNAGLESVCIINELGCVDALGMIMIYQFDELMALFGSACLNQLKEFKYTPRYYVRNEIPDFMARRQPDHIVNAFVEKLSNLESLALSFPAVNFYTNVVELLHRIALRCKNLKHLELYQIGDTYDEIFNEIKSFKHIESLIIQMVEFQHGSIVSLVEKLPLLYHLHVVLWGHEVDWSFVLAILSKCPSLEKLTIASENLSCDFEAFTAAQFFDDFKECTQIRNVTIEVKSRDQTVGTITKNRIVWRNKVVLWVGYDSSRNLSKVNLSNLANKSKTDSYIGEHDNSANPFDIILSYLDLNSLQALSKTNWKCSQLVGCYAKRHCEQQGTFTITNEFFTPSNWEYTQLDKFAELNVTSLRVNICHHNVNQLQTIIQQFHSLNKLHVFTSGNNHLNELIVPQIRHLIFDGNYFHNNLNFYELSCLCPDLEILELKQKNFYHSYLTVTYLEFNKLEKFVFKYANSIQLEGLQDIFSKTNAQLIPIYVNTKE